MIHIEQNQSIPENENIFVASPTGDYEDNALIEFYNSEDPEKILGAFAAQYVKYGGLVYKFNDPKELGAEILKLEPESTHSAASFVRMQNELLKQFNQGNLEPESLNQAMADEQATMEDQITNPVIQDATSTPTTSEIIDNTITPSTNNTNNSTTLNPIIDNSNNLPTSNSTSTTSTIQDNSTTTDQIINNILDATNQTTTPEINPQILGVSTTTPNVSYDPTSTIPIIDNIATSSAIENEIINNATSTNI